MKSPLRIAAVAVLLSAATTSMAQTPTRAQVFAAQLEQYQSLSGTGPAWKTPSAPSSTQDDPVASESFADRFARMQAESSKSSEFQQGMVPPVSANAGGTAFAAAPASNANGVPQAQ